MRAAAIDGSLRLVSAGLLWAGLATSPVRAQEPVVQAVLFYSPTCPHCHDVMTYALPPLLERFGERFRIVAITVATPAGGQLYQAVAEHFALPPERLGVPALVIGDTVLVGAGEIPARLPGMVERGLAGAGIDWPRVGPLRQFLEREGFLTPPAAPAPVPRQPAADSAVRPADGAPVSATVSVPEPAAADAPALREPTLARDEPFAPSGAAVELTDAAGAAPQLSWSQRFALDRAGNWTAVSVLLFLIAVLALVAWLLLRPAAVPQPWSPAALYILIAIGLLVAAYLSFIEVTGQEAVCGPVGDCNTVQQSRYARLFGVLPIGILGLVGYLAILAGYLWAGSRTIVRFTWALALAGVLFSAYLTFLEPFVIGASCAWCLSSAVIMALLLLATSAWARGHRAI